MVCVIVVPSLPANMAASNTNSDLIVTSFLDEAIDLFPTTAAIP